ncbi:MAG: helix-turn-helix domain-containing protein [Bacteroidota bacterium]
MQLILETHCPRYLTGYIDSIACYTFSRNHCVTFCPEGAFKLVFLDSDQFQYQVQCGKWESCSKKFVWGPHNMYHQLKSKKDKGVCVIVNFKPGKAKYFIPGKLDKYQNRLIDIGSVWNKRNEEEIIVALESPNARNVEAFLLNRLLYRKKSLIDNAMESIVSNKGVVEINYLAKSIKLSSSHFRKRFKEEVGISPSQFCKIYRTQSIMTFLKEESSISLTELTYKFGYFDQSHFIREFKSVVGISPGQFKKKKELIKRPAYYE